MQLDNFEKELQEKLLSLMKEESYKPLTVQEIQELLGFEQAAEFKELVKMLVHLEQNGYINSFKNKSLRCSRAYESCSWEIYRTCKRIWFCRTGNGRTWMIFSFHHMKSMAQ